MTATLEIPDTWVVRDPEILAEAGYTLAPVPTLENTDGFAYWRKELDKWCERIEGLHTVRAPKPHQLRHAAIGLQRTNNFLSWTMGCQKCLAKGTGVLMFDGTIKKVEDVRVGDLLMGPDSKPRTVLELYQGRETMYEITSSKGDKYTVNESHILSLKRSGRSRSNGKVTNKWKTGDVVNITVRDFLKLSPSVRKNNYKQYKVGVEFPAQPVPLDPYFLGLWLGDGSSEAPAVTTMDEEIVAYLGSFAESQGLSVRRQDQEGNASSTYHLTTGDRTGKTNNPVRTALKMLEVWGNKHIPHAYKANDRATRLALLAGIIDSDGSSIGGNRKNNYHITFKNQRLADDVVFLARSLGFAAYVKPVKGSCVYRGEVKEGTYYEISLWGDTQGIPVKLARKQAKPHTKFKDPLVASIELKSLGEGEYYGFNIDGDHLFILENFVVTHNTLTALLHVYGWFGHELLAGRLKPGTIHILAPRHTLRNVWIKEMERSGLAPYAEIITNESQLMNAKAPIFVYHYDFLKVQSDKGNFMKKQGRGLRLKANGGTVFLGHPIAKVVAKLRRPSLVILDEIHRLRPGTERTRCTNIVLASAKRRISLTGTPMDGWVHQMAPLLTATYGANTHAFPYDEQQFAKRFTQSRVVDTDIITGEKGVGKQRPVPGVNHMQIPAFIRAVRPLMHRLNLQDPEVKANVEYPRVFPHMIRLQLDPEQRRFYDSLHRVNTEEAIRQLEGGAHKLELRRNMLTLMNDLRMASSAPWARGYTGKTTNMIEQIVAIVRKHQAEGRKGLIGTTFIEESRVIHEALQRAGIRGVRLHAEMSHNAREEALERFLEDDDCAYLISNKELVAEGLNLAEAASYTVSCSHGYRANIEAQWLARVARPGQVWSHVDAYTLINEGTIDVYVWELMMAKIAATASMIDLDFTSQRALNKLKVDEIELAELVIGGGGAVAA